MNGKLSCYNGACTFNFNDTCTQNGVANARYCDTYKSQFDEGDYSKK